MRNRNTLAKRLLAMSISVVVGLSGVNTSMAESMETETEGTVLSEEDTTTEQINEDDIGDTNEGVEEDTEKDQENKINEEQEVGTEETINDCIETEVEVTVTPTPEPTETPVTEEQRETFDYDSVYQSLATTWKEGTDNRRDQVVLSALKKVDLVKYLKGAGHTEDYIGLYGLTGVESSLYLVDNSEFLDDTGLVAATLRSVGFSSEFDWIASEGADFGSRSDLFSLVESSNDLRQGDIGIDTDGVVGIYCGKDDWVYSDYSTGWVEFDDYGNRIFNQYWSLTGYSDSIESSEEKGSNQTSEGIDLDLGKKDSESGDTESSEDVTEPDTEKKNENSSENSGITIENSSEGIFDENGVEVKEDVKEPEDDSIEKKAQEINGINGEDSDENLVSTVANTNQGTGDSYVSSAMIKEKVDGTAPFDSDNNPGNDSADKNNIVRSFDTINYTLDYVTAIKGNEVINEAKLYVRFMLPCTKEYAQFDMDTMKWMLDAKLQTTSKGTQILTGYRYLQNTGDTNMIPGAGTLSVGISVKAAPNGTVIKPSFILEMEGSSSTESVILTDETVVSAYPRYNIKLSRNGNCDSLGWYDTNDGSISLKQKDNTLKGRLFGYGIGLHLYNTSADKKLKGIELPTGDLTFDLTTTHSSNGVNMSGEENTIKDIANVFFYGINLKKTFSDNKGDATKVQFVLQNKTDNYYVVANGSDGNYHVTDGTHGATEVEGTVFSPKADGSLVINGLEADTYVLTEIHTSDGYSLLKDPITIEFKQTVDTITPSVATVTGNPNPNVEVIYTTGDRASAKVDGKAVQMSADNQSANARADMEVINTNSFLLPQTGGLGTLLFTILGACAVIVGIVVVTKKSKKEAK